MSNKIYFDENLNRTDKTELNLMFQGSINHDIIKIYVPKGRLTKHNILLDFQRSDGRNTGRVLALQNNNFESEEYDEFIFDKFDSTILAINGTLAISIFFIKNDVVISTGQVLASVNASVQTQRMIPNNITELIAFLETKRVTLQNFLDNIYDILSQNDSNIEKVDNLSKQINETISKVEELSNKINETLQHVNSFENDIKRISDNLNNLQAQYDAIVGDLRELVKIMVVEEMQLVDERVAELYDKVNAATQNANTSLENVNEVINKANNLNNQVENLLVNANEKYDRINEISNQAEDKLNTIDIHIEYSNQKITNAIDYQVERITGVIDYQTERVTNELETTRENLTTDITTWKEKQLEDLTNTLTNLIDDLVAQSGDFGDLTEFISRLNIAETNIANHSQQLANIDLLRTSTNSSNFNPALATTFQDFRARVNAFFNVSGRSNYPFETSFSPTTNRQHINSTLDMANAVRNGLDITETAAAQVHSSVNDRLREMRTNALQVPQLQERVANLEEQGGGGLNFHEETFTTNWFRLGDVLNGTGSPIEFLNIPWGNSIDGNIEGNKVMSAHVRLEIHPDMIRPGTTTIGEIDRYNNNFVNIPLSAIREGINGWEEGFNWPRIDVSFIRNTGILWHNTANVPIFLSGTTNDITIMIIDNANSTSNSIWPSLDTLLRAKFIFTKIR